MPAQLQAGDLDRRITFQRASTANVAPFNEPQEIWTPITTVSARRSDASAAESYRAQEVGAQISTRFTVRYSSVTRTLTPLDRIVFEGKVFNITGIREPTGTTRQWFEIDAVARADK